MSAQHLVAQHMFQLTAHHIFKQNGSRETIDSILIGPNIEISLKSLSNELGRLSQGNIHGVQCTTTIDFIHQHEVPVSQDVTYTIFVLDVRPLKVEPNRVHMTVGGYKLTYSSDYGSSTTNFLKKYDE